MTRREPIVPLRPDARHGGVRLFFDKLYCWVEGDDGRLRLHRLPDDWTETPLAADRPIRTIAEELQQ